MTDLDHPAKKEILVEKLDTLLTKVTRLEYAILSVIILMFSLFTITLVILR